jgi:hypothetical protein
LFVPVRRAAPNDEARAKGGAGMAGDVAAAFPAARVDWSGRYRVSARTRAGEGLIHSEATRSARIAPLGGSSGRRRPHERRVWHGVHSEKLANLRLEPTRLLACAIMSLRRAAQAER